MTLLASWIGVDSRKPSSLYIVSDSRISWGEDCYYDYGKKVFASLNTPNIFGYCGDVLFPLMILSQIVDAIDQGLLFGENWTYRQKTGCIIRKLREALDKYPVTNNNAFANSFEIIYGTRDSDGSFHCVSITSATDSISYKSVKMKVKSYQFRTTGRGEKEFQKKYNYYINNKTKTSRAVFQTFCDTLKSIQDRTCGGSPQLVGLYCKPDSAAKEFGIIYNNNRYIGGILSNDIKFNMMNKIEWRNELFERCDGKTKKRLSYAQSQPYNP